jgi:hypothetical protein
MFWLFIFHERVEDFTLGDTGFEGRSYWRSLFSTVWRGDRPDFTGLRGDHQVFRGTYRIPVGEI